jgi:TetR/AcrR family tetracycline transcriptional repressor
MPPNILGEAELKLDKRRIAEGGLALLAEGGFEGLSTRKLADHFGIKSASLYHHFKNKQQLLDYVADAMVRPAWRPARADESWQEWLIDTATTLRRLLLAHPDGALLYAGASPPADRAEETVALLFTPLISAGYSRATARFIMFTVIRFTIGWTADEQVAHSRGTDRAPEHNDSGFEFGLKLIVSGAEALIEQDTD